MALLKFDGFDGSTVGDLSALFGYTVGGTATAVTGRFAGTLNAQALSWTGNNTTDGLTVPFGATPTQYVFGFAFQASSNAAIQRVYSARNGATEAFNIVKDTAGKLNIRAGTSTTNLATGTAVLTAGQWYYVEIKHNYTGSGNPTITTQVNGTADVTYTGSLNGVTANTTAILGFSFSTVVSPAGMLLDDCYLLDFSGAQNNNFLGDVRCELQVPVSEDSNTGITANTGTTYGAVDEALQDGDTTYVRGNAVSSKIGFAVSGLSNTPAAIFGVSVQEIAKKTDTGVRSTRTTLKSSSTTVNGADQTLTLAYLPSVPQIVELDPNGSVAWTRAAVEAAKIGVEITA